MADTPDKIRLDKWLWQARFFKSRSLSAQQVKSGHVRVNGTKAGKPSHGVGIGDLLNFSQGKQAKEVRLLALGTRRGPAPEAQTLYEDLSPALAPSRDNIPDAPKREGQGRPTKRDRRNLDLIRARTLE